MTDEEMTGAMNYIVKGTTLFVRSLSEKALVEHIIHLNAAVEGLTQNNKSLREAFRKMAEEKK